MLRQCATVLGLFATAVMAHHSTAPYDLIHGTLIGGSVTKFEWMNPHSHIYVDVTAEEGAVEHWVIEIESPLVLQRLGWSKDSLKAGDKILVMGRSRRLIPPRGIRSIRSGRY